MKLLTAELREKIPQIRSQENEDNPMVQAKFFTPWSSWTWYVIEFDGEDDFFGYVDGHEAELGYFSLKELEEIQGPFGLGIERDIWFKPAPLSTIKAEVLEARA